MKTHQLNTLFVAVVTALFAFTLSLPVHAYHDHYDYGDDYYDDYVAFSHIGTSRITYRDRYIVFNGIVDLNDASYARVWFEFGEEDHGDFDRRTRTFVVDKDDDELVNIRVDRRNFEEGEWYRYRTVAESPSGRREFGNERRFFADAVDLHDDGFRYDDDFHRGHNDRDRYRDDRYYDDRYSDDRYYDDEYSDDRRFRDERDDRYRERDRSFGYDDEYRRYDADLAVDMRRNDNDTQRFTSFLRQLLAELEVRYY